MTLISYALNQSQVAWMHYAFNSRIFLHKQKSQAPILRRLAFYVLSNCVRQHPVTNKKGSIAPTIEAGQQLVAYRRCKSITSKTQPRRFI